MLHLIVREFFFFLEFVLYFWLLIPATNHAWKFWIDAFRKLRERRRASLRETYRDEWESF